MNQFHREHTAGNGVGKEAGHGNSSMLFSFGKSIIVMPPMYLSVRGDSSLLNFVNL